MTRATVSDVRLVLPAIVDLSDDQLAAAIAAASCIIERLEEYCSFTDACLLQIEIYLSAHYAATVDNSLSIESEKDACSGGSIKYGFKFGEGIKGTPFGQMANTLSSGCLAEFDKQPVGLQSIGAC